MQDVRGYQMIAVVAVVFCTIRAVMELGLGITFIVFWAGKHAPLGCLLRAIANACYETSLYCLYLSAYQIIQGIDPGAISLQSLLGLLCPD